MSKSPRSPADQLIVKLRQDLSELAEQARGADLPPSSRKRLNKEIASTVGALNELLVELDPRRRPKAVFDPGNPRTVGFFVALALTAQPRLPLQLVGEFHGSGVYAIYYNGDYSFYAPLSRTETPIYVGQAAPGAENARSAVEQGLRLAARLNEHRKNISRAESLRIEDFEYRALVVQSGWETGAENYLIRLFKPIWNKEVKLVYGLGKHGDSADKRGNRRSPWDTLHAGRKWAAAEKLEDAKEANRIAEELRVHFEKTRVFATIEELLANFAESLRQG
jgi:Eco29kI restriction endonuclease